MKKNDGIQLYSIRKDVKCTKCGSKGAVQSYGTWYSQGFGGDIDKLPPTYQKYHNKEFMSRSVGFGGTIPYQCLNCGNTGLINQSGLEGYNKAFETIEK